MQRCTRCDTHLAGEERHARDSCSSLSGRRLRTDGGRREDHDREGDRRSDGSRTADRPDGEKPDPQAGDRRRDAGQGPPPEKQGQHPPHWEQQGQHPQQGDRRQQPRQGDQRQHPQQAGPGQAGHPPSGGGPPGGGSGPGDDDGWGTLGRRELVVAGAGTAALVAGGWWVFLRGPDGAEGAVTAYLDALDDGDFDALVTLIHEDGPMAGTLEMTEAEFEEQVGSISVDVDAVEQYDEETDVERSSVQRFASVFAAYTVQRNPDETGGGQGGEQPEPEQIAETVTVALHPDGDWKLWDRSFI